MAIKTSKLDKKNRAGGKDYSLAALSGIMIALTFPDYGLWPLAFFGLAPLLISIRGKSILSGSWLGFVMGIFYFGMTIYWVNNTMTQYASMPFIFAAAATSLMIAAAALFPFMFCYMTVKVEQRAGSDMALASAPFLWVSLELVRGHLPIISFPWARIADSFYTVLPFIQIADIAGEDGVGFIIVLVNAALVKVIDWSAKRPFSLKKFPGMWVALTAGLVAATLIYGQWRLGSFGGNDEPKVKVALIQGNIDQSMKWRREYQGHQLNIYFSRTMEAVAKGAKLVVWPETAAPFYFGSDPVNDGLLASLVEETGVPILFGAPAFSKKEGKVTSYNRAWVVRPDGGSEKYDKVHLVPFGEYIPLKSLLFFLDKLVTAIGDMRPGNGMNLLDTGDFKAGVQICYEIIFPEYSRVLTKQGAEALVNITNDSWYGVSPASRQSMAMGVFRAVENRIPVLRAAQSGITAIIEPTGAISGETKLFVETTLMGEFTPRGDSPLTIYTRTGEIFAFLCLLVSGGLMAATFTRNRP